jgi:hypothetical protein
MPNDLTFPQSRTQLHGDGSAYVPPGVVFDFATGTLHVNGSPYTPAVVQQARVGQLTDGSGGSATGAIAAETIPDLGSWDGATAFPTAAQATAITALFTAMRNAIASLAAKVNALDAVAHAAGVTT